MQTSYRIYEPHMKCEANAFVHNANEANVFVLNARKIKTIHLHIFYLSFLWLLRNW